MVRSAPSDRTPTALSPLPPNPWGGRRRGAVGILGGSFNPAHEGHRHVSLLALKALRLDEVWWLVSPQNPLKPVRGMAPQSQRIAEARRVSHHPRIRVSGMEGQFGTRFTADTLRCLRRRFPRLRFVWLMGADNLAQIPRWDRWLDIFRCVPIAIFDRSSYSFRALAGKAAHRHGASRMDPSRIRGLLLRTPPAWSFLHSRLHSASSTGIRARRTDPHQDGKSTPIGLGEHP